MGLLTAGQAFLAAGMKAAAGRTVTYRRSGQSYAFTAWPGAQLLAREATTNNAATVERADADYLFAAADAAAAGLTLPPAQGDTLADPEVLDDRTGQPKVFELRTPTGEPCWRYSDSFQTVYRVHCMRAG